MKKDNMQNQEGFTLVELSIVLVIIGLIIGGILAGQDMIRAAEIRSTIAQVEKFNMSTNTFRDKYRYLPGDINQDRAVELGFYDRTATASPGNGDANGMLQACTASAAAGVLFGCETSLYWRDMGTALMVEGSFESSTVGLGAGGGTAITAEEVELHFPQAKMGRGNFFTVFSANGLNFYQLAGITAISTAGAYTLTNSLTTQESYNIDSKMDDGKPLKGVVRAINSLAGVNQASTNMSAVAAAGTGVVGDCLGGGSDDVYNTLTEDEANTPSCQLKFRFN